MKKVSTMTRFRLAAVCAALLTCGVAVHADEPAPRAASQSPLKKYILVLRAEADIKRSSPRKAVADPDLAQFGGKELARAGRERVVQLPPAAIAKLREHEAVLYIARVRMEPDDVRELVFGTYADGSMKVGSDATTTPPTWDSGDYEYDGAGNIKAIGTDTYTYDHAQRLTAATVSGTAVTYAYDSFGNRVSTTTAGQTIATPIDSGSNRVQGGVYDTAGNLLEMPGGTERYTYDGAGSITERQATGGFRERYLYTADDERIASIETPLGDRWTIRDFDGKPLTEFTRSSSPGMSEWNWKNDFYYRDGRLSSARGISYSGDPRYFHLDHLGSTRLVTDKTGERLAGHDYYPFGLEKTPVNEETVMRGAEVGHLQFTGHERDFINSQSPDVHTYIDYMHARYYNPAWGRFLSVDPINTARPIRPQTWNKYTYALNGPMIYVDPDGRVVVVAPAMREAVNLGRQRSPEFAAMYTRIDQSTTVTWHIGPTPQPRAGTRADSQMSVTLNGNREIVTMNVTAHIPSQSALAVKTAVIAHEGAHIIEAMDTRRTLKDRFKAGEAGVSQSGQDQYESVFAKEFEKAVAKELSSGVTVVEFSLSLAPLAAVAPGVDTCSSGQCANK